MRSKMCHWDIVQNKYENLMMLHIWIQSGKDLFSMGIYRLIQTKIYLSVLPCMWNSAYPTCMYWCSVHLADLIRTTNAMVVLFSLVESSVSLSRCKQTGFLESLKICRSSNVNGLFIYFIRYDIETKVSHISHEKFKTKLTGFLAMFRM